MGVQRSKSLFSQVHPLLFIHETKRKGWRERKRWRVIPQREAFDVENKIFVLICPLMKYTWRILSLYTAMPLSLFVFVFTCLSLRVAHTHGFRDVPHVCKIGGEWDNMQPIKLAGGVDKENISNRSMLLLNCSPWEVIIPYSARGRPAVHMHFIQRHIAWTVPSLKRVWAKKRRRVHSQDKNIRWFHSVASCIWASCLVIWRVFLKQRVFVKFSWFQFNFRYSLVADSTDEMLCN